MGTRTVPFSKVIYIEQDDFREDPPKQYFRLAPGREIRLRYAYFMTCTSVVKDARGNVVEVHCTYDPATRGGNAPDGRKVKSTIHWVSAEHAVDAEVRIYETLFTQRRSERGAGGPGFHGESESEFAGDVSGREARAEPARTRLRAAATSSSGWATSRWIRIALLTSRCSIAPLRCATRGPRSRRSRIMVILGLGGLLRGRGVRRAERRRAEGRHRRE